jgi:hypothetical protein
MNAFMHPRNLYKTKPDFSKLGEINEDFRNFLIPVIMRELFTNVFKKLKRGKMVKIRKF